MAEDIVAKYDRNMRVETTLTEPDLRFYDARQAPFRIYGLYAPETEGNFRRLPADVAEATSKGVAGLSRQTSGGRLRFSTDSAYVAIKTVMPYTYLADHFAFNGAAGFDLYIDTPTGSRFYRTFRGNPTKRQGYETIIRFPDARMRSLTIHFPTYSEVTELYIGLQETATVGQGRAYVDLPPFVLYGSSITQGGCCTRPGLSYSNILSRRLDLDHINLGFSGSGKAEEPIVRYMAGLSMSAFVCDYDHNAPNVDYLLETHKRMYDIIREAQPNLPYIMLSRPDFDIAPRDSEKRRDVIADTYRAARAAGDKHVYFIDGEGIFRGPDRDSCTVDGTHPNDVGMIKMADAIENMLRRALRGKLQRI